MQTNRKYINKFLEWNGVLLTVASLALSTDVLSAQSAEVFNIDIESTSLSNAIVELSKETGVPIFAASKDTDGIATKPFTGNFSISTALNQLLIDTGLQVRENGAGIFSLTPQVRKTTNTSLIVFEKLALDQSELLLDEIVIQGAYFQSLKNAIADKRAADTILDVVASENLGKLPEVSIAEALSRLPGVIALRDRGNASALSVRGLGPDLTTTFLNGRELATGESTRNIRYDVYPAELIHGVYVHKTPLPWHPEGGIGGSVNLKTVQPLDFTDTQFVVTYRANHRPLDSEIANGVESGFSVSSTYIDQYTNETLGVALGFLYQELPSSSRDTTIYPYQNSLFDLDGDGTVFSGDTQEGNSGDLIPFGWQAIQGAGLESTLGIVSKLQFSVDDTWDLNADLFYTVNSNYDQRFGARVDNISSGTRVLAPVVTQNYLVGGRIIQNEPFGATLSAVGEKVVRDESAFAGGVNLAWQREQWGLTLDLGYSTNGRMSMFTQVATNVHDFVDATPVLTTSGIDLSFRSYANRAAEFSYNIDLTDRLLNLPTSLGAFRHKVSDEIASSALDVTYTPTSGIFDEYALGARVSKRSKNFDLLRNENQILESNRIPIPSNLLRMPANFGGGEFNAVPPVLSYDFDGVVDKIFGGIKLGLGRDDLANGYSITEVIRSAYLDGHYDTHVLGVEVNGHIGFRITNTVTKLDGFNLIVSYPIMDDGLLDFSSPIIENKATESIKRYTEILPSLHINFPLTQSMNLRFAVSRQLARPSLETQKPGVREFVDLDPAAFGGNSSLDPFVAWSYDASWEWYFSEGAQLSLGTFYKNLDTYIVNLTRTGEVLPSGAIGSITQPVNADGGSIYGLEAAFVKKFELLPSTLGDLGVWINYAWTQSDVEITPEYGGGTFPLPGLAETAANVSLFYSHSGFDARLGYRYVNDYPIQVAPDTALRFTRQTNTIDAQLSYKFPKTSKLSGVSLLAQGNNLTNEPFRTRFLSNAASGAYEEFGATYWFGVNYEYGN